MAKQKEAWKNEENKWYQQAVETAQALKERPAFSYAPERDPLYQAAKQTAVEQGRRAMEDTLGKTAGLSGGYASSYAQSVGTQAYDRQISKLRELLPDYYDRARANYDRETDALHDTLSTALGLYDKDYQSWLDRQSALEREAEAAESKRRWDIEAERKQSQWEAETAESRRRWDIEADRKQNQWEAETAESRRRWDIEAGRKQSQWEAETAESKRRWEAETAESKRRWDAETNEKQLQWLSEFAEGHDRWTAEYQQAERKLAADQAKNAASRAASEAEKERSYAYRMAILALQQGVSVSDALLKAAGIDKAYAESLRRYYAYRR